MGHDPFLPPAISGASWKHGFGVNQPIIVA